MIDCRDKPSANNAEPQQSNAKMHVGPEFQFHNKPNIWAPLKNKQTSTYMYVVEGAKS